MTKFWLVDEILSEISVSIDIFLHAKKALNAAIRKLQGVKFKNLISSLLSGEYFCLTKILSDGNMSDKVIEKVFNNGPLLILYFSLNDLYNEIKSS